MNEELQSTNEELQTLNDELRERSVAADGANSLLHSIFEGVDIPVVVVDSDYRVQLWNTAAERATGLRDFEAEGLLLLDIALDLPVDELHGLLRKILVQGIEEAELSALVTNRFGKQVRRHVLGRPLGDPASGVRGGVLTVTEVPI